MNGAPAAHGPPSGDAKGLRDPCSSPCASRAPCRPSHPVHSLNSPCHPCQSPSLNRYGSRGKRTTRKWSCCCPYHPFFSLGGAPDAVVPGQSDRLNCDGVRTGKVAAVGRPRPTPASTDQREEHRRPDFSPGGARNTCEIWEQSDRLNRDGVRTGKVAAVGCPRPTPASTFRREERHPPREGAGAVFLGPPSFAEVHVWRILEAERAVTRPQIRGYHPPPATTRAHSRHLCLPWPCDAYDGSRVVHARTASEPHASVRRLSVHRLSRRRLQLLPALSAGGAGCRRAAPSARGAVCRRPALSARGSLCHHAASSAPHVHAGCPRDPREPAKSL